MKRSSRIALTVLVGLSGALSTALLSIRSRSELHGSRVSEASIEPVLSIAASGMGGVVSEVCARPNDRVREGQVLIRFDASQLRARWKDLKEAEQATQAEMAAQGALERVPERLKRYLYETHPDVVESEQEYVAALDAWEQAPAAERPMRKEQLAAAAEKRTRARRQLDRLLAGSGGRDELGRMERNIRKSRAEVEQLLRDREVRARADGSVEILDLKRGDRILPGLPAAAIRVQDEYTADLAVPNSVAARIQRGATVPGSVKNGPSFAAVVASVTRRKIPAAFRENRDVEEEIVVNVRFHLTQAIPPGSTGQFYLP